jgi:hypothetical protein
LFVARAHWPTKQGYDLNRNEPINDSCKKACNFRPRLRVGLDEPGDDDVGNGSIDANKGSRTGKRDRATVQSPTGASGLPQLQIDSSHRPNDSESWVCGAMSEQHGQDGRGNESVPQKFVRLVGCRDPNVRNERGARPHPGKGKR